MKILIYKRTHVGDPNTKREFGNENCMGRVRNFPFDLVIGVGGVGGQPIQQRLARKINWVGRKPKRSANPSGCKILPEELTCRMSTGQEGYATTRPRSGRRT